MRMTSLVLAMAVTGCGSPGAERGQPISGEAAQKEFIGMNAELSKVWKPIVERKPAPEDADEWKDVKEKKHLIEK